MEDLVDRDVHPPVRRIKTDGEEPDRPPRLREAWPFFSWTTRAALVLLAVFVVATSLAGLLGPLLGLWAGLGLAGLALSSLVASILLGAS